jgi:WD40 repeat protein
MVWNPSKDAPIIRYFAHDNVIETVLIVEGENSGKLMGSEFLKHKFTGEARMNAIKKLSEQGAEGLNNYYQPLLLTGGRDKVIKLFTLLTGEHLHTFFGHDNWVRSLSLHATGKYLYSAADDKTIRVWDLQSGKEKKKTEAHELFISTVQYNSKYGVVASSGNDAVVKLWHLKAL